jgi:hypothetical protein
MTTVLLGIVLLGFFFLLMSVRLIFIRGGKFKGTCASQSPFLNKEGASCGICGRKVEPDDDCQSPTSEVTRVLSKFK